MPRVSVVLPVRNARETLPECLESIRHQSLQQLELVAVDDGSEDGSLEILSRFVREDPRGRILRPGRVGLVSALNLGWMEARAPLIARMDADDLMHESRLEIQADYLEVRPDVALVASQAAMFPEFRLGTGYREYMRWQNSCLTPEEIAANIYVESPLAHPSVMVRRSVLEGLGGYRHGPFPEDYDLWLRMHQGGLRMAKIPRVLLQWRERDGRLSRVDPRYAREAFDRLRAGFLARDPRVRGDREVVIWGAGRRTRLRARLAMDRGVRPCAWIDVDPRKMGRTVWGLPVHPPTWLERRPRPFVLVYVARHGAREEIAAALQAMGYGCGADFLAVG